MFVFVSCFSFYCFSMFLVLLVPSIARESHVQSIELEFKQRKAMVAIVL